MASRIIHLAFSEILCRHMDIPDIPRFRFGHILPDLSSDPSTRRERHYIYITEDGQFAAYDFPRFAEDFAHEISYDSLYFGYYIHLVEDALFRDFFFNKHGFRHVGKDPSLVEQLHRDYRCIDSYFIGKYNIQNNIALPPGIRNERINQISRFDYGQVAECAKDFEKPSPEEPVIFTRELADAFIHEYKDLCIQEAAAVSRGGRCLTPESFKFTV